MPKLPEFQTDEELIEWFDSHDTADYMDEMEEVDEEFVFMPTNFPTRPLELRLQSDMVSAIEELAARRGIPYQLMVRDWIQEKLTQEAPELALQR